MIICIVGPTGVGKTKLSIALAKEFNGEIINADAVQVYKGLDIGSAKVTKKEQENIKHHLLDICNVTDNYTIYNYQKDCRQKIKEIKAKNKIPIIVGGSGLYIKSALYDYDLQTEQKIECKLTNAKLYAEILKHYPDIEIDKNNRRRLLRAYSKIKNDIPINKEKAKLLYDDVIFIGLKADRNILYNRINERVDKMLINLVDEVKSFYLQNIHSQVLLSAIGYKELYAFFNNECSFKECVENIKKNSRHYAKRQYTFFNHQLPVNWFDVNYPDFNLTIKEISNFLKKQPL